jgi:hypothetical protein
VLKVVLGSFLLADGCGWLVLIIGAVTPAGSFPAGAAMTFRILIKYHKAAT